MKNTSRKRKVTHTVEIENGLIKFTLALDGKTDYADYHPVLYRILCKDNLKPFRDEDRLRFMVWKDGADVRFYFYDLVLGCHKGLIHEETYLTDLQDYFKEKRDGGFCVDHADNNTYNNTTGNLSWMERGVNSRKNEIVARFKPPYYLNSVHCDDGYRVQFLCEVEPENAQQILGRFNLNCRIEARCRLAIHSICPDAESYVNLLQRLANSTYEWMEKGVTPKAHAREKRDIDYWAGSIKNSLHAQHVLKLMPRANFTEYRINVKST